MSGKSFKEALYAPFDLADHEVRELRTTSNGKVQWLAYVRREAIQNRLDELFWGEWSTEIVEVHRGTTAVNVRMKLEIRGVSRENNGSQVIRIGRDKSTPTPDEHTEKGAVTDAFKRVASMWGIGLYLQSSPMIYTDDYRVNGRTDWNKFSAMEKDALNQLGRWLQGMAAVDHIVEVAHSAPAPAQPQTMIAESVETVFQDGTPFILAGHLAYAATRQPFMDAGYDTSAWVKEGTHPLTPYATITFQAPEAGNRGEIITVEMNRS